MKIFGRCLLILLLIYTIVFAVADAYLVRHGAPIWLGLLLAVAVAVTQYAAAPLLVEWLIGIRWDDSGVELPARNRRFLENLCAERGLKMPRVGIIDNPVPNAFAFGHAPADARIVVTAGLLSTLSVDEINAVLAHELGHVEQWDFVVTTMMVLAPLTLWQLYTLTHRHQKTETIALGAYACYSVSQLLVLLINRTREYSADHYAAEVTRQPGWLASALLKMAYGAVKADGDLKEAMQGAPSRERAQLTAARQMAGTLALMGISNLRSGAALALAGSDAARIAAILRWDLVNPWARFYELNSTHPLIAHRVRALNHDAESRGHEVAYPLPHETRRDWKTFTRELAFWAAPGICAGTLIILSFLRQPLSTSGIQIPFGVGPSLLVLAGITWMVRTRIRYSGVFQSATIEALLADTDVSPMRSRAVRLEGEILGFGVPGAFWSPDLILRDATGIVFVPYRPALPFTRLVFAGTNAGSYIGQKVAIEGWFRRGIRPYVEVRCLTRPGGTKHAAHSRWIQHGFAAALVAAGVLWFIS